MAFDDSSLPPVLPEDAATLVLAVTGSVLLPGDAGYDEERAVFNLNHELRPAVIVVAQSAADVQAAVAFAAGHHRPVLVKTTGHQIVGAALGAVLITTHRMNGVVVDAVGRTARVGAGALWAEVVQKAAKAGLAPLNGSNPTVGVSGYTLGGGLSPTLGRSHGYAADHVRSLDVVTADGELRMSMRFPSPSCSGRCAAARATSRWSRRWNSICFRCPACTAAASIFPGSGWPMCCVSGRPGTRTCRRP